MGLLIDELSRIIASPIPRRKALRLAGSLMGGGILAYLGFGRASRGLAQTLQSCGEGQERCGSACCYANELCCGGKCYGPVIKELSSCCGRVRCNKLFQRCCTDHCCRSTETCCGARCCSSGRACCNGQCCAPGAVCCGSACCGEGYFCCNNRCLPGRPSPSHPCA